MNVDLLHPDPLVILLAGVLGAIVGSFLNVCILRLPKNESIVRPRSKCPGCGAQIAWYDNIPIISWLLLGGRCRRCGQRISIQYPLVELVAALIWGYMAFRFGVSWEALRGAVFGSLLLGITMTDARDYIIPDEFTLGGLAIGLLFSLTGGGASLGQAVLGAAVGFALLWFVGALGGWILKQEAMGGGDIKMMAMVGAFLLWKGVLLTIFLGSLIGSLIFLPLTLMGKRKLVPFGVFLSLGAAASYLVGPALIDWYRGYLVP